MTSPKLHGLGWSRFFAAQLDPDDAGLVAVRIAAVHRSRLMAETGTGQIRLDPPAHASTMDFAVGDWVLIEPGAESVLRRLERRTLLRRRTEGGHRQLIAANVDSLFIVTSCNEDFNLARLERYLALANEAGIDAVIVLTKIDQADDAGSYLVQAKALQRDLGVVLLNAKAPEAVDRLSPWCGPGQTVAIVGSSGVGKSTLVNNLADKAPAEMQLTRSIREGDAKGRHTTTSRSLHTIAGGACLIDTPGMRTLHVSDVGAGLDVLFAEITELAPKCRFSDCTHAHEPGCAVQAAVAAGALSAVRLDRWRKLRDENRANTPVQSGPRRNKAQGTRRGRR
ncbi:ribosome small subunit-dependent GTPase A [Pararhodobacter sp. SW119]|uniref:ribosome small subunit-dependent GTPase A n=1 Tax=Pararhodobacter sp. SW119 TaxID=2780075 RepID=UPI001ADF9AAD|nr:ribosome small subunit-dependent GTPase A [Pararhodobacter sp. SW119]